jgi:predicted transposase/invertase (TIGR01784 family)
MPEINNIHDTFFRETMSHKEVAADFLVNYLPAGLLEHIKLETLAITKDTFVDKKQAAHSSDLLYQVKLTGDRPGFVYFLFEHKSYPDRFVSLQLLRYIVEIWELYLKQHKKATTLPLIIPIVVYHGKPKGKALRLVDLIDLPDVSLAAYVPDFDLAFYDFSPETDAAIKGEIWLQLVLHCLQAKSIPTAVSKLTEIIVLLAQLDENAPSLRWIEVIFRYLSQTMDIDRGVVQNLVQEIIPPKKEGLVMTIAEQWKQEGRMEGRLEGRMEGEATGRNAILSRQLAKRFGLNTLDIRMQERLRNASPEQLDRWAERILDAKTVDDVFGDEVNL